MKADSKELLWACVMIVSAALVVMGVVVVVVILLESVAGNKSVERVGGNYYSTGFYDDFCVFKGFDGVAEVGYSETTVWVACGKFVTPSCNVNVGERVTFPVTQFTLRAWDNDGMLTSLPKYDVDRHVRVCWNAAMTEGCS